ncbi:MAG: sugar transferase, partial [Actinobacteria bacterium]|nr:sugar transferase [Actinomycetota bacterium]
MNRTDADIVSLPVRHLDGPFGSTHDRAHGAPTLKRRLVSLDVGCVVVGWLLSVVLPWIGDIDRRDSAVLLTMASAMVIQLLAISGLRLQKARVAARRSAELSGLGRSALAGAIWAGSIARIAEITYPDSRIIAGAVLSFGALAVFRGLFSSWLRTQRALGNYSRSLVLVGVNEEAASLRELLGVHPELGYRVVAVVGDREAYEAGGWGVPLAGDIDDALNAVAQYRADGVLIAASALAGSDLNRVSRELLRHEVHVHLSSGLTGIDLRRLRPLPLSHEPIFYLEQPVSVVWRLRAKRAMDLVLATTALIAASPILAVAALGVKLTDRGPVFFKQTRVGLNGEQFLVYKLRTMVPDAESRLGEVLETLGNGRDGVLFKLENDPRRTRIGRLLEASSIDELPQLLNVLNGTMSLVGPRPPLPREVEEFDDELMRRFLVKPGVTGLWQVEAREN